MAVQKNKMSRSKRDKRRTHDSLKASALSVDRTSGDVHLRHHVSPKGYYRGTKVITTNQDDD